MANHIEVWKVGAYLVGMAFIAGVMAWAIVGGI
jgi:hypothetical protein